MEKPSASGVWTERSQFMIWMASRLPWLPTPMRSKPRSPPEKPEITRIEPRGMQRGTALRVKIAGTNLYNVTKLISTIPNSSARLEPGAELTDAWITVKAAADLPPGAYDLSVANAGGESGKMKLVRRHVFRTFIESQSKSAVRFPCR